MRLVVGTHKVGSSCEESRDWFAVRKACSRRAEARLLNCPNPTVYMMHVVSCGGNRCAPQKIRVRMHVRQVGLVRGRG